MSYNLSNKFKECGYNYTKEDESTLKRTQEKLKGFQDGEQISKLLNNVVESMMEDKPVVTSLCNQIDKWVAASEVKNNEVLSLENLPSYVKLFINSIKTQNDFKKAYLFKDAIINIWLIIDKSDYESSTKYISLARESMNAHYKNIDLMIYSIDEIDEVLDELEGSEYKYKEISNG